MKLEITSEASELRLIVKDGETRTAWVPKCRTYGDLCPEQDQEWRSSDDLLKRALDPEDSEYTVRVQLIVERSNQPDHPANKPAYCAVVNQLVKLPNELHPRRNSSKV